MAANANKSKDNFFIFNNLKLNLMINPCFEAAKIKDTKKEGKVNLQNKSSLHIRRETMYSNQLSAISIQPSATKLLADG